MASSSQDQFHSLTGLRFVLAAWIAYFHVGHMFDPEGLGALPALKVGMARVDVFFVLSGFVLTHVYWARTKGRFDFADFFIARVARLYPLHLAALALMALYVLAGVVLGRAEEAAQYTPMGLLGNLLMLQAWGWPGAPQWNFPAWTLSAEFAGYLVFPAYLLAATAMRARPWSFLGLSIAAVLLVDLALRAFAGRSLGEATVEWGALRGAGLVFVGVAARVAFDAIKPGPASGATLLALIGALIAAFAAIGQLSAAIVAAGSAALILGLARLDRIGAKTPLSLPFMRTLGDWSYALFILHVPLYVIAMQAAGVLGVTIPINAWTAAGFVVVATIVTAPAHYLIEEPARKWLRASWAARKRRSAAA
jgi:peptidoglycan/LPS O-acetylase OafA/YrhL